MFHELKKKKKRLVVRFIDQSVMLNENIKVNQLEQI